MGAVRLDGVAEGTDPVTQALVRPATASMPSPSLALRCSPIARARSRPPDSRRTTRQDRRGARGEGRGVCRRRRSDPEGEARRVSAARLLSDRPGLQRARRAQADRRQDDHTRCRPRPAPTDKMRRVGSLEFTLKGQPMKLPAFNERRHRSRLAVRRVQRSHERHRNLRRPAASWISTATPPASTRSTSTAPTFRTATTTRPTSARYPPRENRLQIPDSRGER